MGDRIKPISPSSMKGVNVYAPYAREWMRIQQGYPQSGQKKIQDGSYSGAVKVLLVSMYVGPANLESHRWSSILPLLTLP